MIAFVQMAAKRGDDGKRRAKEDTDDTPASAADLPHPDVVELLDAARFAKKFGRGAVAVAGGFGLVAWYLIASVHGLDTRLSKLETAFDGHKSNHNNQWSPGPVPAPDISAGPLHLPSAMLSPDLGRPPQPGLTMVPRPPPPPRPSNDVFPEDVPTVHPQRCISRQTRKPVTCTPELACRPAGKVYSPTFRKEVVSEAAGLEVTAETLVCEP
jgi:hypothetical protein